MKFTLISTVALAVSIAAPVQAALKIDGRRAHDLARRGAAVELAPRKQFSSAKVSAGCLTHVASLT